MITLKRGASLAVFGLALGMASIASADEVQFTGSTLGAFNGGTLLPADSYLDLTFSNSTFDNATVGGFLNLGGNPEPGANFNNLGSFVLGTSDQTYNGATFQLAVEFTAPFTINGGSTATFTSTLTGAVSNENGGVFIDFNNTPQNFTFSNANFTGSFSMFVNDVSLSPGQTASLTGRISASQQPVPEPATIAALGVGAIGLLRRRSRSTRI